MMAILGASVAVILIGALAAAALEPGDDYRHYCNKIKEANQLPRTCLDMKCRGFTQSGVYTVYPEGGELFHLDVFCDHETDGGGWTVFQRRIDGSVDFYRNWNSYKLGFGDLNGNFWMGNDKLSFLTGLPLANELRVDMEAVNNSVAFAKYSSFSVGGKSTGYKLSVSGYSGTAGDALSHHNGIKFSTFDVDQDARDSNCAQLYGGAWWYTHCHFSHLNGEYLNGKHDSRAKGIIWLQWKGFYESLKTTEMKFRARP